MAMLFVFDNIGNMMGPVLGGKTYEAMGVGGIGVIAMGLGVAEMIMILVFVRNSLDIRKELTNQIVLQSTSGSETPVKDSTAVPSNASSSSVMLAEAKTEIIHLTHSSVSDPDNVTAAPPKQTPQLWRLLLQLPVLGPTVSIFVATGMQSVIETILPLRLYDKFGYSPSTIGVAFLIVGGVLILAMPVVGKINDYVVSRHGEHMRYYIILVGVALIMVSLTVTAVAGSYAVLVFGYALFGVTSMVAVVPAQSAFGDFINQSESQAMAQCYSLAWIAEGLANISLPPIASGLYSAIGFLAMLMSMGAVLCTLCGLAVMAFPIKQYLSLRKSQV
ncbi:hypothetical protein GGI07_004725 [Coemansia sp. Benny D115]|nr:hypothetical protein GGI07_004725 [Coemansia sp. Benny D115]